MLERNTSQPIPNFFTEEQLAIINSNGNKAINAVAGSGKTTTIIAYAANRSESSKILYLAFNKSVKLEAIRKFANKGLLNVTVETAHSLAFRHIINGSIYKVKAHAYKTQEISEILGLEGNGEKHAEFIIANHINKFITYFCNSDKLKVQELNYADTVSDPKAKRFVRSFYKQIETGARLLLAKMDKAEIEITHDFYLKKFQLASPVLPFDYILFDEGQDASAAMLDVFLKQKATKLIVGDAHQQIYGWRHAVNSLTQSRFNTLELSASFRFPQEIADLAAAVLLWKKQLFEFKAVTIKGLGKKGQTETVGPHTGTVGPKSIATLARSNLGLLLNAINYITDKPAVKHIYFEGNINSYTYADDGASLYDVLSLYNGNYDRIRDKLIRSMKSMDDLEAYIKSSEDAQLGMMVEIVNEYGNEIPSILKSLKNLHTGDEERHKAEMIFSTVHRAKGMEYDEVYLVNDFITEEKLERIINENKKQNQAPDTGKLNEEINLLYVAITRVKTRLHIPEFLLPENIPLSPFIQVVSSIKEETLKNYQRYLQDHKPAGYDRRAIKTRTSYKPWTSELDHELIGLFETGQSTTFLADHFGRTKGAIISRLKKLSCYPEQ